MNINCGDFVVVQQQVNEKFRRIVVQVSRVQSDHFECLHSAVAHLPNRQQVYKATETDVIANLGIRPVEGTVYGAKVLYCRFRQQHEQFNTLYWMYEPAEENIDQLRALMQQCFTLAYRILRQAGLAHLIKHEEPWEIHKQTGNMGGCYVRTRQGNSFRLFINDVDTMIALTDNPARVRMGFVHTILHEIGHSATTHHLQNSEIMLDWIKAFNTLITVDRLTVSDCRTVFDELKRAKGTPLSKFESSIEVEQTDGRIKNAWEYIKRQITVLRNTSLKELTELIKEDQWDEVEALWPDKDIPVQKLDATAVSLYACKNYKELICEAFAIRLMSPHTKQKMADNISRLMEQTMSYLV